MKTDLVMLKEKKMLKGRRRYRMRDAKGANFVGERTPEEMMPAKEMPE